MPPSLGNHLSNGPFLIAVARGYGSKNRSDVLPRCQSLNTLPRDTVEGRWHPVFVAAPTDRHDINDPGMDHFSFVILDVLRKLSCFFYRFRADLFLGGEEPPKD